MRIRLALIGLPLATLVATPALAQQETAGSGALANRIAAATEALSQYRSLDNGVWASVGGSSIKDRRPDLSRKVTVRALQFGYDHRFTSAFTRNDQLVLGVSGGALNASSRADAQNLQIDSHGWSATAYGVYSPLLFLSFPVAVTVSRWSSDQTRDGTPLMPVYSSSYKSTSWASSVGAALTLPLSKYLLTTSLSHRYSDNNRPAYTEAINPAGTDFQTTPGEITRSSQLVGNMRLALPFQSGRVWASAGYAYDLSRAPSEDTRSEYPLGLGFDVFTARWQVGASGQVTLRHDITSYGGSLTGRLLF
jgi:hypothetical protein